MDNEESCDERCGSVRERGQRRRCARTPGWKGRLVWGVRCHARAFALDCRAYVGGGDHQGQVDHVTSLDKTNKRAIIRGTKLSLSFVVRHVKCRTRYIVHHAL